MKKRVSQLILTTLVLLSAAFIFSSKVLAAGRCGYDVALSANGDFVTTKCLVFGGTLAQGDWQGCSGIGSRCFEGDKYDPCATAASTCDTNKYDTSATGCQNLQSRDGNIGTPWVDSSCVAQKLGCFVYSYTGSVQQFQSSGSRLGACSPPKVTPTQIDCTNRPEQFCKKSEFPVCYTPSDAISKGVSQNCSCTEPSSAGTFCLFRSQAEVQQKATTLGDNKCPLCPEGSYVQVTGSSNTTASCYFFDGSRAPDPTYSTCSQSTTCQLGGSKVRGGCATGEKKPEQATFDLCRQANIADTVRCNRCLCGEIECDPTKLQGKPLGIWTAVGCIPSTPQGIVQSLLRVGLGMAGGLVVLSVLAGAFMLATSSGEPKKVQEAQELISSAIIGLLFVVFSVIILQFIGVQILRLPGFGSPGTTPPPAESIQ